jgi:holo-[acyl-carrier protein] synthase
VIVGVGLDITEIPRISAMLERWGERFTRKIFTEGERAYAMSRPEPAMHFAARFSAKEATLKALCVPPGLSWHEMEVVGGASRPPRLELHGRAAAAAAELGIARVHVSISHTADVAAAVVIAESGPAPAARAK